MRLRLNAILRVILAPEYWSAMKSGIPSPRPISIVLVDDHSIVREGVAAFFASRPDLHIAGQCSDGLTAVEMIQSLAPDFAIIDLCLPVMHGLEVIRKVRETNSVCKLVVLTVNRDEKMVRAVTRAGANGYVLKGGPARHLLEAIGCIQDGSVYISPLLRSTPPDLRPEGPDEDAGVPSRVSPKSPRRPPTVSRAGAALRLDAKLADAIALRRLPGPKAS